MLILVRNAIACSTSVLLFLIFNLSRCFHFFDYPNGDLRTARMKLVGPCFCNHSSSFGLCLYSFLYIYYSVFPSFSQLIFPLQRGWPECCPEKCPFMLGDHYHYVQGHYSYSLRLFLVVDEGCRCLIRRTLHPLGQSVTLSIPKMFAKEKGVWSDIMSLCPALCVFLVKCYAFS